MNYFLVGNGFDLHHKFPTGYINFLNVMKFLVEHYDESYTTVGAVLKDERLQEKDTFLKECYEKHEFFYDLTELPGEIAKDLITRATNNVWFLYFCNCVEKDIRWIDFEKEISRVIEAFHVFFNGDSYDKESINGGIEFDFREYLENGEDRRILSQFDFFFEKASDGAEGWKRVKEKYTIEKVAGSEIYYIETNEIVFEVYSYLREFANLLRDYLKFFVDNPARKYVEYKIKPMFGNMPTPNRVFSFNYTNLYEILYGIDAVDHIHGKTDTDIVLGVNPDENDNVDSVDTTFLQFKKYYQRVFYGTDNAFINHCKQIAIGRGEIHLWVVGHSLDSTDEDVIRQVFAMADRITILYHDGAVVKDYISHLVEIYGKDGLDSLREERKLRFLSQPQIRWELPS